MYIQTAKKAAFYDHGLAWIHAGKFIERCIQRQKISLTGAGSSVTTRQTSLRCVITAFLGMAAAGRFDEQLAHGPGRDSLEVQTRGGAYIGRVGQL